MSSDKNAGPWVYFIQAGENGPIKIGWTGGDPRGRLASLQTGNHEPLRLLAFAPGSLEDERALHERFADARTVGEWFKPFPEVLAFVLGVAWSRRRAPAPVTADGLEELACGLDLDDLHEIANFCDARRLSFEVEAMANDLRDMRTIEAPEVRVVLRLLRQAEELASCGAPGVEMLGGDLEARDDELARQIDRLMGVGP